MYEYKMKVLIFVLTVFFGTVLSGPAPRNEAVPEDDPEPMKYFLVETSPGVYQVEDLVNAEIDTRADETDITYHFFNQRDPLVGVDIKSNNIDALRNTRFSASRESLFVIHGWKNNNESDVNYHVREAILEKHNINLFVVDWSPVAGKNYVSAKGSVVKVGQHIANFVKSLASRYGLRVSTVSLVGHSLGAQIAGNAGAALNGEVDHIVGLDPAGPLFTVRNTDERLDPTDGKFVQVIHTNGGLLGFKSACGDADYYPNGGGSQPGCGLDIAGTCAHSRAYVYYAEAVLSNQNRFVSEQCSSYRDYGRGNCKSNDKSVMGGYSVDARASGDYYLDTNNNSPYAKGE
ncbi:hypothetical protein NQ315_010922 [Exocentrus adspersus]|uniref:Lipase domain-containing protein n=1 Tax=Exocentrus adspersus TaxID=1586481 RepID=A0AAV8VPB1_9CUCU|nr:hypothetical protein NQ315_010922 [Exocentrus adspersus]